MLGALGYVVLGFVANAHHRGVCPAEPLRAAGGGAAPPGHGGV